MNEFTKALRGKVEADAKRQYYDLADKLFPGPPKGLFFDVDAAVFELVQRRHPHPPSFETWKEMSYPAATTLPRGWRTRRPRRGLARGRTPSRGRRRRFS